MASLAGNECDSRLAQQLRAEGRVCVLTTPCISHTVEHPRGNLSTEAPCYVALALSVMGSQRPSAGLHVQAECKLDMIEL